MPGLARRAASRLLLACLACAPLAAPAAVFGVPAAAATLEPLRIALDWTPNVDFLGIYVAINNGYFTKEGIKPVIIPYAGTPGETLIAAGKTDLAFTYPPSIPAYRASGLAYRAVAGLTQVNTIELAVLKSSPYKSPAQLSGKLYGGFGVPSDQPIIDAIFSKLGVKHPVVPPGGAQHVRLPGAGVRPSGVHNHVRGRRRRHGRAHRGQAPAVPDPGLPRERGQLPRRLAGGQRQRDKDEGVTFASRPGRFGRGLHLLCPAPRRGRTNLDQGQPRRTGE